MKTIFQILLIFCCVSPLFAQDFHLKYSVEIESENKEPMIEMMIQMLPKSFEIFQKDSIQITGETGFGPEKTYVYSNLNHPETSYLVFKFKKAYIVHKSENNDAKLKLDVKKTGQTKTIKSYPCEKFICTFTTSEGSQEMTIWGTKNMDKKINTILRVKQDDIQGDFIKLTGYFPIQSIMTLPIPNLTSPIKTITTFESISFEKQDPEKFKSPVELQYKQVKN